MLTATRARIGTFLCAAAALAGCGGGDGSAERSAEPQAPASPPRTADYQLARVGGPGIREAFLTLTGRSDGKTTAVLDFYVPRDPDSRNDLYAIAFRAGTCDRPGALKHDLGEQSSGTSVLTVDAGVDELADSLDSGRSTVTIAATDGKTVAWCGP
jgi:hypothetical protein